MSIIYSDTNIFPLKIRESIQTRKSGLKEYNAVYVAPNNLLNSVVNNLINKGTQITTPFGTFDVFPEPSISKSNDSPFSEIQVNAYGMEPITPGAFTGHVTENFIFLELSKSYSYVDDSSADSDPIQYNWTISERWKVQSITFISCAPKDNNNFPTINLQSPTFVKREILGKPYTVPSALTVTWLFELVALDRSNYGGVDELAGSFTHVPTVT